MKKDSFKKQLYQFCYLIGLLCLLMLSHPLQAAQKRVALVIGNAAYQRFPGLVNPVNDATDMATKLRSFGFDVTMLSDASKREIEDAISVFSSKLGSGSILLFITPAHEILTLKFSHTRLLRPACWGI